MNLSESEVLHEIHRELKSLTDKVESAFIKDEEGNPDYAGHRTYHKNKLIELDNSKKYRMRVLSAVSAWAIIGVLTILGSALVQVYITSIAHK